MPITIPDDRGEAALEAWGVRLLSAARLEDVFE